MTNNATSEPKKRVHLQMFLQRGPRTRSRYVLSPSGDCSESRRAGPLSVQLIDHSCEPPAGTRCAGQQTSLQT